MNWWSYTATRLATLTLAMVMGSLELWALQRARWTRQRSLPRG
ncbi:hypothetical protein RQP54_15080 [Curvibacter sp. APW13]|nr:hypothetical protein [Curvibacter sp. APW13]MDT8992194.1 hypothetical protein [Curvibacter sp. APW13]